MDFDFSKAYDGHRLTNMARASVQANGNLHFPPEAARQMGLTLEMALLICPMGEKDLAVTLVAKDDPRGFVLRKTGPYFYVPFRSLMNECGIDYVHMRVVFDIIQLKEMYEGRPVFKFNRRLIDHTADGGAAAGGASVTAPAAGEVPAGEEGAAIEKMEAVP